MLRDGGRAWAHDIGLTAAVAAGLEAALHMRAPDLTGTTAMVRQLAVQVSRQLGLDDRQQTLADLAARVRDVGMIGLPDSVVLNTGPLSAEHWALLNRHPVLGAELLGAIPEASKLVPVVRAHHERWDGEGYPDGLRRDAIPLLSRVISVCDAFVAIASDRPHRRGLGAEGALEYLSLEGGSQFDPDVVESLLVALTGRPGRPVPTQTAPSDEAPAPVRRGASAGGGGPGAKAPRSFDLPRALAELEVVPAFAPALERAVATLRPGVDTDNGKLVATIESDLGLTVAVLRRAQGACATRPIASVSDAVVALGPAEIGRTITALPRAAFPWQTPFEALLHRARVHAQAVARASERLARSVEPDHSDDLLAAALLHDLGKLALGRAEAEYSTWSDADTTPEQRLRRERHAFGMDHATLSGILLERWGLPGTLSDAVAGHHTAATPPSPASFLRLADMVAHLAQGNAVDRNLLLELASAWRMPVKALRDALFDLPHSSGSRRRRAEPSPLSNRETSVLKLMAEGQRADQIAHELHLSVSTVRSHLHNVYAKLSVPDRAQAVLLATERAWI